MPENILDTVKAVIGIPASNTDFDVRLILATNSILNTINQIGIGEDGFRITGNTETWNEFLGNETINVEWVKEYLALRVWLIFDVSGLNSGTIAAIEDRAKELETRFFYENEITNIKEDDQ